MEEEDAEAGEGEGEKREFALVISAGGVFVVEARGQKAQSRAAIRFFSITSFPSSPFFFVFAIDAIVSVVVVVFVFYHPEKGHTDTYISFLAIYIYVCVCVCVCCECVYL